MEYPQPPATGPTTRVNWTQTATITIAAFVGCLAAVALMYFMYKSRLGDSVRKRMVMIDQLNERIDDLSDEYQQKLQRRNAPVTAKPKDPGSDETSNQKDAQTQESQSLDDEEETPASQVKTGQRVTTVPVV